MSYALFLEDISNGSVPPDQNFLNYLSQYIEGKGNGYVKNSFTYKLSKSRGVYFAVAYFETEQGAEAT